MIPLASFLTPPGQCGYLPEQTWQLHYEVVASATADDYELRLINGWRRFGRAFFRPRCPACQMCRSIRVMVDQFAPDRSQRRNRKANEPEIRLEIGVPEVSIEKLSLYDRYHAFQVDNVGWNEHAPKDAADYHESFVDNPFPTEEWRYYLGANLIGLGYVDVVASGLSAIYFFHEPAYRDRGLGTWNVLCTIAEAARRRLPYAYLGYLVEGCRSSVYKGRYRPFELFDPVSGVWWPGETEVASDGPRS